jgi:hypothetical protein
MNPQCPHEWIGPKECIHCGWWPDPADQSRRIIAELAGEAKQLRVGILTRELDLQSLGAQNERLRELVQDGDEEISRLRAMILQTPGSRCTSCLNPLDHHAVCPCQEDL